jgi:hypothetical protein
MIMDNIVKRFFVNFYPFNHIFYFCLKQLTQSYKNAQSYKIAHSTLIEDQSQLFGRLFLQEYDFIRVYHA